LALKSRKEDTSRFSAARRGPGRSQAPPLGPVVPVPAVAWEGDRANASYGPCPDALPCPVARHRRQRGSLAERRSASSSSSDCGSFTNFTYPGGSGTGQGRSNGSASPSTRLRGLHHRRFSARCTRACPELVRLFGCDSQSGRRWSFQDLTPDLRHAAVGRPRRWVPTTPSRRCPGQGIAASPAARPRRPRTPDTPRAADWPGTTPV